MAKSLLSAIALISILASPAVSQECRPISYTACGPTGVVRYYDPDTGEICPYRDCGGGRAPVKYDVPGCAAYTGTELPKTEKSYLPCWTGFSTSSSETSTVFSTTTTVPSSPTSLPSGGSITTSTRSGTAPPDTTEPPSEPFASKPAASGAESSAPPVSTSNAVGVVVGRGSLMAVVVGAAFGALL